MSFFSLSFHTHSIELSVAQTMHYLYNIVLHTLWLCTRTQLNTTTTATAAANSNSKNIDDDDDGLLLYFLALWFGLLHCSV